METIRGIVRKHLTPVDERGKVFARVAYETDAGLVETVLSGFGKDVKEGDYVVATGEWRDVPAKGRYPASTRFWAKSLQPDLPTSTAGAVAWLSSIFTEPDHGASARNVSDFVARHGARVAHLCEGKPETLLGLTRTPQVHREAILRTWGRAVSGRRAFSLMEAAGVPKRAMQSIHDVFLDRTYDVIRSDPYRASRVKDVGFANVDKIGQHIKIGATDDRRVSAALVEVLNGFRSEGSTFARVNAVGERMDAGFGVSLDVAVDHIKRNLRSPDAPFVIDQFEGGLVAALRDLREGEKAIAEAVAQRLASGRRNPRQRVEQVAKELFATKDFERFDETQRAAVVLAASEPIMVLTGGPGTGKSAVSEAVVAVCKKVDRGPVLLCAPTGKAAMRLQETTKQPVTTLHLLLEAKEVPLTGGSTFGRNRANPLPAGCTVLCDEASMLDVSSARGILDALPPDGRLILVGDKNQLPSVDAGAVLADLLSASNPEDEVVVPSVELVTVYRQARTSSIATGAAEIKEGRLPFMSSQPVGGLVLHEHASSDILARVKHFVKTVCVDKLRLKPHQFCVLTPQAPGTAGTWEINRALSEMLNPHGRPIPGAFRTPEDDPSMPVPRVGDRVMATKNDYERKVNNGDVGTVLEAGNKAGPNGQTRGIIKVRFDAGERQEGGREVEFPVGQWRSLSLAYAITIHKSQGSQYHTVVMPVTMAHANMLDRALLYTGWTRAKTLLCVVGEREALERSVATVSAAKRATRLPDMVRAAAGLAGVRGTPRVGTATTVPPHGPKIPAEAAAVQTTASTPRALPPRRPAPGRPAPGRQAASVPPTPSMPSPERPDVPTPRAPIPPPPVRRTVPGRFVPRVVAPVQEPDEAPSPM